MEGSSNEIIDLTGDHEVIVLDSDSENTAPGPSKISTARNSPSQVNGDDIGPSVAMRLSSQSTTRTRPSSVEPGPNAHGQDDKRKKARRKKKRKSGVVVEKEDGEEGEIEELSVVAEDRREDDKSVEEDVNAAVPDMKSNKGKEREKGRGRILSRGTSPEHRRSASAEEGADSMSRPHTPKEPRKRDKKRKRREKDRPRDRDNWRTRSESRERPTEELPLFFIDEKPAEISVNLKSTTEPTPSKPAPALADAAEDTPPVLLLPAHVMVFEDNGDAPIEIIPLPPPLDSDDEDFIEYLNYDDNRRVPGLVRYFDDPAEVADAKAKAAKATRTVCKNCGAEDEHKTYECPVIICLTCGARDEHVTRSCPISKTCFSCGMKGHVSRSCPNRSSARAIAHHYDDCGRCGSSVHITNECPTLWRMYEYVEDTERQAILNAREQKRDLAMGEGGEGYIAPEDWCYNCGGCGHLGDDCKENVGHTPWDRPREPSGFSEYNTMTGPFYDSAHPTMRAPSRAATYASRAKHAWGDGYGAALPLDVGKQGRKKERTRLEKRAQELQEDDDDNDWFARHPANRSGRNGGGSEKGKKSLLDRLEPTSSKKINIGNLGKDRGGRRFDSASGDSRDSRRRKSGGGRSYENDYDDLPTPMRETDTLQIRGASRRYDDRGGSRKTSERDDRGEHEDERRWRGSSRVDNWDRDRNRRSPERRRDKERDRDRSPRREPRYRGGYSR